MNKNLKNPIIILCVLCLFSSSLFLSGCTSEEGKLIESQQKEIFKLVDEGDVLQAKEKAQEYFKNDEVKKEAMIATINKFAEINENSKKSYQRNDRSVNIPGDDLLIQDHRDIKIKDGYVYINGSVINQSDKTIRYYKITVKYLDENNKVVHSNYTNSTENLCPGESREFEIMNKYNGYKYSQLSVEEVRFK